MFKDKRSCPFTLLLDILRTLTVVDILRSLTVVDILRPLAYVRFIINYFSLITSLCLCTIYYFEGKNKIGTAEHKSKTYQKHMYMLIRYTKQNRSLILL